MPFSLSPAVSTPPNRNGNRVDENTPCADHVLTLPVPSSASRNAVRVNAASGETGDGRVNVCLSREDFEAASAKAGDNLVSHLPPV